MNASGAPLLGRAISWGSDNAAVVVIDGSGLATAVAPGTTTIHANSEGRTSNLVVFTVKP